MVTPSLGRWNFVAYSAAYSVLEATCCTIILVRLLIDVGDSNILRRFLESTVSTQYCGPDWLCLHSFSVVAASGWIWTVNIVFFAIGGFSRCDSVLGCKLSHVVIGLLANGLYRVQVKLSCYMTL